MTPDQLEREIAEAMFEIKKIKAKRLTEPIILDYAKACAEICRQKMREVAEKAFDDAYRIAVHTSDHKPHHSRNEWLKENNLL